jgi:cGMP-dependent protein kinase
MAPEVILGEGYSFNIDFWSISICIYEFMCGGVPFGESCDDPMDVYTAIVNNELNFPPFVKDSSFKNAMKALLKKNPVSRVGNMSQIKAHPWFDGLDWVIRLNYIFKIFLSYHKY